MKKLAKKYIVRVLNWQVQRLYRKNTFKVVAVVGSIGKTSTKTAVAELLASKYQVQYQAGNYNDVVTVPLVYFGLSQPSLLNPVAWLRTFWSIEQQLRRPYTYDVVVVELGTDYPGNIDQFKSYVVADIAVVTALTAEHMEYFGSLEAVAYEELSVADFAGQLLVNRDLCESRHFKDVNRPVITYGKTSGSDYRLQNIEFKLQSTKFSIDRKGQKFLQLEQNLAYDAQLYSLAAAVAVGDAFGLTSAEIKEGLVGIKPVSGRMQRLEGLNGSIILDDTYNSSPEAAKLALSTLYRLKGRPKIALLGNMNEMGDYSEAAHKEVGNYCDPKQLDLVVTLGGDANIILAEAARKQGCEVIIANSPYEAGELIRKRLVPGTIVLAKGSQNGVFAEEAVKMLLQNVGDAEKLVRQSPHWLIVKARQFGAPPEKVRL